MQLIHSKRASMMQYTETHLCNWQLTFYCKCYFRPDQTDQMHSIILHYTTYIQICTYTYTYLLTYYYKPLCTKVLSKRTLVNWPAFYFLLFSLFFFLFRFVFRFDVAAAQFFKCSTKFLPLTFELFRELYGRRRTKLVANWRTRHLYKAIIPFIGHFKNLWAECKKCS